MRVIKSNHSGQVALIMVLIMTVVSAVAVSVASRSTVETKVQQLNIDNTQAILTAQAGLEDAITQNSEVSGSMGTGKQYAVTVSDDGSTSIKTDQIAPGETVEVNLVGAVGVTGLKVYWRSSVPGAKSAIFATEIRSSSGTDYGYDSDGSGGFTKITAGGTLGGLNYDYVTPVISVVSGTTLRLRITALVSPLFMGIEPVGGALPPQTRDYKSVAKLSSGESTLKYGVEYVESKSDQLPSIFDYVMFSNGSIVQ